MPRCLASRLEDSSSSPTPAASTRVPPTPPPPWAPPLPLGYYDEDELVIAGGAIIDLTGSAAQPRPSVPPLPMKNWPLASSSSGVSHVIAGDFVDVETGQQQQRLRSRAFTVVVVPPPQQHPQPQRSAAWRRAGHAVGRFCGVVAQAVVGLVLLVVAAVLLLLLFVVVASAVKWCRGRETCHW